MGTADLIAAFNSAAPQHKASKATLGYAREHDAEWQVLRFYGTGPDGARFEVEKKIRGTDDPVGAAKAAGEEIASGAVQVTVNAQDAKERDLAQREAAVAASEQAADQRKAGLDQREAAVTERERAVATEQAEVAQEESAVNAEKAEVAADRVEVVSREDAVAKREEAVAKREATLPRDPPPPDPAPADPVQP